MASLIREEKIVKEESLDLHGCNKIILKFSYQDIDVSLTDDDKLNVVQLADDNFKEEERFISTRTAETIEIKAANHNAKFKITIEKIIRRLKVSIPKSYASCLEIKTGVGSININDNLKLDNLNIESSSGNFNCSNRLEGNEVSIKSTLGNANFKEIVSKTCKLETSSGGIKGDSINGDNVSIKSSLGSIRLSNIVSKTSTLESSSGGINVDFINGDNVRMKSNLGNISLNKVVAKENKIETSSGKVNIETINGDDVNIKTSLGSVALKEITSNLYNIETSSGKINIDAINGSGSIGAKLGDINVNYKDIKEYSTVKATSGNLKLYIPKELSCEFWAECTAGKIKSNFDINYKTRNGNKATVLVGEGSYKKLNVSTTLGNIEFNENNK